VEQSEWRYRSLVESINDVLYAVTPDGLFSYVSPQWETAFGHAPAELLGQPFTPFVHPDDLPACQQFLAQLLATGESHNVIDARVRRKDGEYVWYMVKASLVMDPTHGPSVVGVARDISQSKRAEQALIASEDKFRRAFQLNPDAININRLSDGVYVSINDGFTKAMGYTEQEVLGRSSLDFNIWEQTADRAQLVHGLRKHGVVNNMEARFRAKDGRVYFGLMSATLIDIDQVPHILSITRDIDQRKEMEEQLQLAGSVFTHVREGIMITTVDGSIVDVNAAFSRITGYCREEVQGRNARILASDVQNENFYHTMWCDLLEHGYWKGEVWNRRKNGELFAEMLTISAVRDAQGQPRNYVGLFTDITALKEHEKQLETIAHFDSLTGLPNRVLLSDRLQQGMTQALHHAQLLAVVYLDLDGFKEVNDRHGHQVGDQLLIALASRMRLALREGDTLARIGGDEFVAVLLNVNSRADCVPLLARLLTATAPTIDIGPLSLQVTASLGVSFYPQKEDVDADHLLRQSDQAMYQAKLAGKNRFHAFDDQQDRNARSHNEDLSSIRRAMQAGEFVLLYQPKVNMRLGTLIGAEALIRWQHPQRGLLLPLEFLPVIENNALAIEVGEWVIESALRQTQAWRERGLVLPVSVNLSARQLQQPGFVERLRTLLAMHPTLGPGSLELEILETSALIDLTQVSLQIQACQALGVSFALDDFGTGYSTLTYLRRLPVTVLKIDQSFVQDMLNNLGDLAILQGILGLASAFQRQVIAEGVQSLEHGSMLLQMGCDLAQGYGIARPMPGDEIFQWKRTWQADPGWRGLRQSA
jgi:diguanylate cyclase (GGDEF)-like protein/PAS domain S-box-containing protein